MAVRIIADTVDELPEALRSVAAKDESGKATVAALPEGWGIEDVSGLRGALSHERAIRKMLDTQAKAFGWAIDEATGNWKTKGIDPAKAYKAVDAFEAGKLKSSEEIEAHKAALSESFASEKAAIEAEKAELQSQLGGLLVDNAALEALTKGGAVSPKVLMPLIRSMAKVERQSDGKLGPVYYDENGKPILSKKAGANGAPATADEIVEHLRGSQDYRALFRAPAAGGSGGSSQSGGAGRSVVRDVSGLSPAELIALGDQGR